MTAIADDLQTKIMQRAAQAALEKIPNRTSFLTGLRRLVAGGTGRMVAEARRVERDAQHLGRATATHIIDQHPPTDADRARAALNAPKVPRNADLGTTVRAPKGLQNTIKDIAPTLYGSGSALYDDILKRVAMTPPESDTARRRIAQKALDEYKQRGITGFVDKAGRRWNMVTYVEMATRTAASDLAMRAHIAELQRVGVDVVRVTVMPNCHPFCKPYQGRLLSLTGATQGTYHGERVVATLAEALAHGFRHPNAILGGDQEIETWAQETAASKGAYSGPAVVISTAQGNRLTVSPHHPVLTTRGWKTAQSLREGDHLFSAEKCGFMPAGRVGSTQLDNVKTTIEDKFQAIKLIGASARVSSAGNYFNDDRQFLKGKIDIVMTDGELLDIPDPQFVEKTGEVTFDGADMSSFRRACVSSGSFGSGRVYGSIGRPLSNLHTVRQKDAPNSVIGHPYENGDLLAGRATVVQGNNMSNVNVATLPTGDHANGNEPMANSRRGDSQDPGAVIKAVPVPVKTDKVVGVEIVHFTGHAYDFQTVEGVYAVNSLIVHNCRHSVRAHLPGMDVPDPDTIDPGNYKATQDLRAIEREIRREKRVKETAVTPEAKAAANRNIQNLYKRANALTESTGIPRNRWREQIKHAL